MSTGGNNNSFHGDMEVLFHSTLGKGSILLPVIGWNTHVMLNCLHSFAKGNRMSFYHQRMCKLWELEIVSM